MNPDSPKPLREELESRLSALLLGELPADETALLREIIAHDPKLAELHDQLKQTISLVRETIHSEVEATNAPTEPLQLSEERRKKLQTAFLIPPLKKDQKPKARHRSHILAVLLGLAIIGGLAAIFSSTTRSFRLGAVLTSVPEQQAQLAADTALPKAETEQLAFRTWGLNRSEPAKPDVAFSGLATDARTPATPAVPPPTPQPVQIVLPPAQTPQAAPQTVSQTLGEPEWIATLETPATRHSATNAFVNRYAYGATAGGDLIIDPSTGLPFPQTRTATAQPKLETRTFSVNDETLRQGLESLGEPAFGRGYSQPAFDLAIPRVSAAGSGGGGGGGSTGGVSDAATNTSEDRNRAIQRFYAAAGVNLDATEGKSLFYNDRKGTLLVRATPEELDVVGQINEALAQPPPRVNVQARFSEVAPDDGIALGVDWHAANQSAKGTAQSTGKATAAGQSASKIELQGLSTITGDKAEVLTMDVIPTPRGAFTKSVANDAVAAAGYTPSTNGSWTDPSQHGKQASVELAARGKLGVAIDPDVRQLKAIPESENVRVATAVDESVARRASAAAIPRLQAKKDSSSEVLQRDEERVRLERETVGRRLSRVREQVGFELQDLPIRKPATNAPIPQPEVQTSENNFSTFSLNVSDVSFKLAAASLEKGQMPDAASVRSEEFINAFDYRDPEPLPGAPIAFAWERARYPFAVNRDLLRFSLKTAAAGRQTGRPLNVVLLLDNSGSMERADRVQIIREALRVLASQLQPQDKLSVITFARTARLVADGIPGNQAAEVTDAVSGLTPQGGTNLEQAMNLAYETAARHYLIGGINRVALLTDGAANLGDVEPASLKQKVEEARQQGIAFDCFGVGWEGFNDDLLEVLSRNGDGRYGFINSAEEAATEFAGQLAGALKVAASDVKVQVEFNPARVTSYRQVGYAKHQLTKEQFRDNTVDAAEIAAQEAGNALYTVEVNPAGSGPLCTVRVRYKIPGTTEYREQAWDVPYTGNAPALDQSSPAMRLAATAAAFAEWLVASPFAGNVTPDAVLGYLRGVPEVFGADSRPKKLEWMIRQARSIEGR